MVREYIKTKNVALIIVCIFIVCWILKSMYTDKQWQTNHSAISSDVIWYYEYLPVIFIYHDYAMSYAENYNKIHKTEFFYFRTLTNHKNIIKMSMGMAMLYSPFFFMAHGFAHIFGYNTGGFSEPYSFAIVFASLAYFIFGLFFLSKLLLKYVNQYVASLVLLFIVFGTNLYYYITYCPGFSHHFNFTLIVMFLWYTIKWHETKTIKNTIILGVLAGLISLIRPTNTVVLLSFILWDIKSIKDCILRLKLLLIEYKLITLMIFICLLFWIPQCLYWKYVSNTYFFYSYTHEHFYFNNPHIVKGLIGYRKGWLIYSPVMILSVIGQFFLLKKYKEFVLSILLIECLFVYIVFSWWCWWYGGSFGMRAMIDIYGLLAIPMAIFIQEIFRMKRLMKIPLICISLLLFIAGIHNLNKYLSGSIHYDSMTKEAFWDSYLSIHPTASFYTKLKSPELQKALTGQEETQY